MILYISIDGVRPDALLNASTPTFDRLQQSGSFSFNARSVMPTKTLPCHMSTFHSVPPERHNILVNTYTPMARPVPGLIEVLSQAGKRCASFISWEPLRDLSRPLSLSHMELVASSNNPATTDDPIVEKVLPYLKTDSFDFIFLYLASVDEQGHLSGWMSDLYLRQVEHIDSLIAKIMSEKPDRMHVLIHSDHGGHDRMHGTDMDEDMLIPWFLSGPKIKQNQHINAPINLLDTAPTITRILNVTTPDLWEGRVIKEAFEDSTSQ